MSEEGMQHREENKQEQRVSGGSRVGYVVGVDVSESRLSSTRTLLRKYGQVSYRPPSSSDRQPLLSHLPRLC